MSRLVFKDTNFGFDYFNKTTVEFQKTKRKPHQQCMNKQQFAGIKLNMNILTGLRRKQVKYTT
jgi:hypothetical protein